ncbi:MAG: hypothetical protein IKE55_01790 [Kiritimatiellae bacterium]|nr:hypothetical protein [Kiritimatiellia bacterium]
MAGTRHYHSAYWYAYHKGWTYSEAGSYAGAYLDIHTYRPCMKERPGGEWRGQDWFAWRNAPKELDSTFNPLLLGVAIAMDIGVAMRDGVRAISDPQECERMRQELMRDLRIVRRPFYYARETERRRRLAAERRKIRRRRTTAPMPTPEDVMAAWGARKESREAMVRLGGMLQDLECYVDSCLRFDGNGNVVGRNGGIRGWIRENVPELFPKYKTLMRYKAMAVRLRQATDTKDPTPTSALLDAKLRHKVVEEVVMSGDAVFEHLSIDLELKISPNTVLLYPERKASCGKRRGTSRAAVGGQTRRRMLR